jgi:hypothetical protein
MGSWVFVLVVVVLACGCAHHHHIAPAPAMPRISMPVSDHPAPLVTVPPVPTSPTSKDALLILTGCLGGSNGPLPYRLTDEQGRHFAVGGIKDLDNHVGHTVKLTGRTNGTGFSAITVEDLAQTCTSLP